MATSFRDFSRGAGGRRGTGTLGGGSTSTTETGELGIEIDATGIFDFFKQRDQDKSDRNFLKKNAEDFGFTPDEIDDFSREDLRSLKSSLLEESVGAGVQGEAGDIFRDLINQVPQDQKGESEVLQAIFGEGALPGTQVDESVPTEGIREMDVLGLGGEQAEPRFIGKGPIGVSTEDDPRTGELGIIQNPNGSRSTEVSITIRGPKGKFYNIPTLVKGQVDPEEIAATTAGKLTRQQEDIARKRFKDRGGFDTSGFDSEEEAIEAAQARSDAGASESKFRAIEEEERRAQFNEEQFNLVDALQPTSTVESGLQPSVPINSVQPQDFGKFVDESTDPSQSPMQQLQDALVQMNPRDAFRVQSQPFFRALLEIAKRAPPKAQVGQLVQDAEGNMWNVTFDAEGNVKKQVKLNIKKAPSTLKNTTKILQAQNEDGSIGMEAVTFDSTGKLSRREPLPGIIPKSFNITVGGLSKGARNKAQTRLIQIKKSTLELERLEESLRPGGTGKSLLSTGGKIKNFFFTIADRVGAFDPDTLTGEAIERVGEALGSSAAKDFKAQLEEFTRVSNLAGGIVVAFQKEITGVAGPVETFDRLEAISTSIATRGIVGMIATIKLSKNLLQDEAELLEAGLLARNTKEFIQALDERTQSRIDTLKFEHRDNRGLIAVIEKADAEGVAKFSRTQRLRGGSSTGRNGVSQGLLDLIDDL